MVVMAMILMSCHGNGNKDTNSTEAMTEEQIALLPPQKMQTSNVTVEVTLGGKKYNSTVLRQPDESLPVVSNQQGQKYVDNRITLRLSSGGQSLVNKEFTKASFMDHLDAGFKKYAILEGLVYDKVTPQGILYAASVAYPESDLYVPFRITVTPGGNVSIVKSDEMDEYDAPRDTTELVPNTDEE